MRPGTLQQAADEHHVQPGRVRTWATQSGFPPPLDTQRRPFLYDLDVIAAWVADRPGQGARTDLRTEEST